jgi:hypothetical protein
MDMPGVWKIISALMKGDLPQMFGFGGVVKAIASGDSKKAQEEFAGTVKIDTQSIDRIWDQVVSIGWDMETVMDQVGQGIRRMISRAGQFNTGGLADGSSSGSDDLFARLTKGEYVMAKPAVRAIGASNLDRMNRTGTVGNQVTINFEPGSIAIGAQTDPEQFAEEIMESIKRRSLDGDFVMAVQGLRFEG